MHHVAGERRAEFPVNRASSSNELMNSDFIRHAVKLKNGQVYIVSEKMKRKEKIKLVEAKKWRKQPAKRFPHRLAQPFTIKAIHWGT